MDAAPSAGLPLSELYAAEAAQLRAHFEASGDGRAAAAGRTALADRIIQELHRRWFGAEPGASRGFAIVAVGGYGCRRVFPHSDVDILLLSADARAESAATAPARSVCQALWDLRFRLSPTWRTLQECAQLRAENPEFSIALLDARLVAGDARLFEKFRHELVPKMIAGARDEFRRSIRELTRQRHARYGDTIFHLEPNLKNSPGGLRDLHVASWLARLAESHAQSGPVSNGAVWPIGVGPEGERAFAFLAAARCFLHYAAGRDDNVLYYERQAEAASRGLGVCLDTPLRPEGWMREYFRQARAILQMTLQRLDEACPSSSSLSGLVGEWRSRLSHANFTVQRGRIQIRRPALLDRPEALLDLAEFLARSGLELSAESERALEAAIAHLPEGPVRLPDLWARFERILVEPHSAEALRVMHRTGLLARILPEFAAIDALVVRDYFHRYTVDAHTLLAIENLHRLRLPSTDAEKHFAEVFSGLEEPELLLLAVLLHDVGKGIDPDDHVASSLRAAEGALERLGLAPTEADVVRFLIANHLEMSATLQRRDIFDPETIRAFSARVGTPERLKMLTLFTFADIRSVNPEVLTPWKAEKLWQLYIATSNHLTRALDEERWHAEPFGETASRPLRAFLEGLPKRYLPSRTAAEREADAAMAARLSEDPVQLRLIRRSHFYELTVVTPDRPRLFAAITGTLAGWGQSILKAEAFANAAGVVLDTFHFVDLHHTLELNPSEVQRFEKTLRDVLAGRTSVESVLAGRLAPGAAAPRKIHVPTEVRFDEASSLHSTLLELVAQDRPGLLYQIGTILAEHGVNIDVALIDTEGQKAIDVFYVTAGGKKLTAEIEQALQNSLLRTV